MNALKVLLLTQENCAFCDAARAILLRLEREYPISLSTLPLETLDGQSLAERNGILFPPGIFIDDEPVCYGRPSERALRREIERRIPVS